MNAGALIAEAVAGAELGRASAVKRGRREQWPYVPVVIRTDDVTGQELAGQIRGLAYATRAEAVEAAQASIDQQRALLEHQLWKPNMRALREHYGLPRELPGPAMCPCEDELPDPCPGCGASVAVGICPADGPKQ